MLRSKIIDVLKKVLPKDTEPRLAIPEDEAFGHYSTNIAFQLAEEQRKEPLVVAENIVSRLEKEGSGGFFKKIEAVSGFVNFWLKPKVFQDELAVVLKNRDEYGRNNNLKSEKTIVEYTDPNPFKEFHIGHLMSNSIGEAISRLIEWNGAKVKRACYQGDVGLHVAKTIWGMRSPKNQDKKPGKNSTVAEKIKYMASAYALGSVSYATDEKMGVENEGRVKEEIHEINRLIYNRSDHEINKLYDWGRRASLEYFEGIYKKLGTKFDYYFFESETGEYGKKIVERGLEKGIFEKSDGAVIFRGEKYGLHTRVFISSEGLPTYEAKDLGLAEIKYKKYAYDKSIIVTGNEVNDYFRVVLKAMAIISPDLASKTKHLSHGILRLPTGKMSSRTGEIVIAESLIGRVEKLVAAKVKDVDLKPEEKSEIEEIVSIGALKYSILKQAIGGDIVFDFKKSISFEGDSGPYLQYSYVRARSVLEKAEQEKIRPSLRSAPAEISELEPKICYFPEVVEQAGKEYAPNHLVTYLVGLARTYNGYYAKVKIVDSKDEYSPYKVALTSAFMHVMKNGLEILGISAPDKM